MDKRKLGNDGTTVSATGIGALSFSDFYGPTDVDNLDTTIAGMAVPTMTVAKL